MTRTGDINFPLHIDASTELNDSININWTDVPEANKYTLYRDKKVYKTNLLNNFYNDIDVQLDKEYEYSVQAFFDSCGSELSHSTIGKKVSLGYAFYATFSIESPGITKYYASHDTQYDIGEGWVDATTGLTTIDTSDIGSTLIKIQSQNEVSQVRFYEDMDTTTAIKSVNIIYGVHLTSFEDMCNGLSNLETFDFSNECNATNFNRAWANCSSLANFPSIDTSKGTTFDHTWMNCSSLYSFPQIDVSSSNTLTGTWQGCINLTSFPDININAQYLNSTWADCSNLETFPVLNTTPVLEATAVWRGCRSLLEFPVIDLSNCTKLDDAWRSCVTLTEFPLLDVSNVTSFRLTWAGCNNLNVFPNLDISSGIDFSYTWAETNIVNFPELNFYSGEIYVGTFSSMLNLVSVGIVSSTNNARDFRGCFKDCASLECIKEINTTTCDWSYYELPTDDPLYFNPAESMFDGCLSLQNPTNVEIDDITTPDGLHYINSTQCPTRNTF